MTALLPEVGIIVVYAENDKKTLAYRLLETLAVKSTYIHVDIKRTAEKEAGLCQ